MDIPPVTPASFAPRKPLILAGAVGVVVFGLLAGFLLSRTGKSSVAGTTTPEMVSTSKEKGSTDTKTFRDSATGTLDKGGLNGEGTHKLVRDGGPSQTVYLVSSVLDLEEFIGKKVEVWGETHKGTKASWLMDVGRIKILE